MELLEVAVGVHHNTFAHMDRSWGIITWAGLITTTRNSITKGDLWNKAESLGAFQVSAFTFVIEQGA
jgi:hypothetical protein